MPAPIKRPRGPKPKPLTERTGWKQKPVTLRSVGRPPRGAMRYDVLEQYFRERMAFHMPRKEPEWLDRVVLELMSDVKAVWPPPLVNAEDRRRYMREYMRFRRQQARDVINLFEKMGVTPANLDILREIAQRADRRPPPRMREEMGQEPEIPKARRRRRA